MPPKRRSLWDLVKFETRQFCLNTSLHGYKFIVLPKRILLERVVWGLIVVIALITGLALILMAWYSFQKNPVILVTESTHYPIWNFPYPAVTICSFNKFSKNATYSLAKKLSEGTKFSVEGLTTDLQILSQMISNQNGNILVRGISQLQNLFDEHNLSIDEIMKMLSPSCNKLLQRCKWKGEEKACESIFEPIKTYDGFCCSFNYKALKNHTFGGILPNKIPKAPRHVSACGPFTALEVLVNSNQADYSATTQSSIGHKILIHNAYIYPDWTAQHIFIERKLNALIGLTPSLTSSTVDARNVQIANRKCYFYNESQLLNFEKYTYENCLTECRMNLTRLYCNCIPFYYHNEMGDYPRSKICNLEDLNCLQKHKSLIWSSVPGLDLRMTPEIQVGNTVCGKCLPDCDYTDYVATSSAGVFTRQFSTNQLNLFGGVEFKDHSIIRVFFNDLVSTKNRRDVIFSWHTLLAYYGGLLGLFIGFSFVAIAEMVYFFTVRLVLDMKFGKKPEEKQTKEINKPTEQIFHARHFLNDKLLLRRRSNSNA